MTDQPNPNKTIAYTVTITDDGFLLVAEKGRIDDEPIERIISALLTLSVAAQRRAQHCANMADLDPDTYLAIAGHAMSYNETEQEGRHTLHRMRPPNNED